METHADVQKKLLLFMKAHQFETIKGRELCAELGIDAVQTLQRHIEAIRLASPGTGGTICGQGNAGYIYSEDSAIILPAAMSMENRGLKVLRVARAMRKSIITNQTEFVI